MPYLVLKGVILAVQAACGPRRIVPIQKQMGKLEFATVAFHPLSEFQVPLLLFQTSAYYMGCPLHCDSC